MWLRKETFYLFRRQWRVPKFWESTHGLDLVFLGKTIRHAIENFLTWILKIYKFGITTFYLRRLCFLSWVGLGDSGWCLNCLSLFTPFWSMGQEESWAAQANLYIGNILIEFSIGMEIFSQGRCPFWKNFQCPLWDKIALTFSFHCYLKILNDSLICHCSASLFEKHAL